MIRFPVQTFLQFGFRLFNYEGFSITCSAVDAITFAACNIPLSAIGVTPCETTCQV